MDYLFTWLGTIILSASISIANELRMYKDAADAGYKINGRNLNYYNREYKNGTIKNISIALLIPIYNIMITMINVMSYNINRGTMLDNLSMMDALEDMTEKEKQEYKRFPTGLHALIIMIKEAIRLSKLNMIQIIDQVGTSEIYFDITDDSDIEIVKVYGPLSKATKEAQKEKAMQTLYGVALAGLEEFGTQEDFIKSLNENGLKELSLELEKLKRIEEQKSELEELKQELLSYETFEDNNSKPKTRRKK